MAACVADRSADEATVGEARSTSYNYLSDRPKGVAIVSRLPL